MTGWRRKTYATPPMTRSPMTPATIFWDAGALTIGLKNAGSAMALALEAAGDLERHQRSRSGQVLARDDDIHVLEFPRLAQVHHEVRDGDGRGRRAVDLQRRVLLFQSGDPEIGRHRVGERIDEDDRPRLILRKRLDHIDTLAKLRRHLLHLVLLADLHLEQVDIALCLRNLAVEALLGRPERQPVAADEQHRRQVHDAEKPAQIEGGERDVEAEPDAAPTCTLGRQVDPDHRALSPDLRSPRPTATARAGPDA